MAVYMGVLFTIVFLVTDTNIYEFFVNKDR